MYDIRKRLKNFTFLRTLASCAVMFYLDQDQLFVYGMFNGQLPLIYCRFLSPLSVVPLISMVGFGLYELGFPGVISSPLTNIVFLLFFVCLCTIYIIANFFSLFLGGKMCGDWLASACASNLYCSGKFIKQDFIIVIRIWASSHHLFL